MSRLLAAEDISVCTHILRNVFIADCGLLIADAKLVKSLIQAHIAHNGRDDLLLAEYSAVAHIFAADIKNMVAGYDVTLFVHRKTAVGVTVKREADIELIIEHEFLHLLNVRRAAVDVNIDTVGIIGDNIGIRAQSVKHAFCHHPSRTVCTVEADLLALVRARCKRDEKSYVAIAACRVVNGAADFLAGCIRKAVPLAG